MNGDRIESSKERNLLTIAGWWPSDHPSASPVVSVRCWISTHDVCMTIDVSRAWNETDQGFLHDGSCMAGTLLSMSGRTRFQSVIWSDFYTYHTSTLSIDQHFSYLVQSH